MSKNEPQFTHLHVHTEYSLLDGISKIPELVARATELEMEALAITDHGAMYGAVDFYSECKEQGIKPIIGCELYVTTRPMSERSREARQETYHATMLCQNDQGYANLVKLVSTAHLDGYYYRPRVDIETMERHSAGLIALSGCPSGELQRALAGEGTEKKAREIVDRYQQIFGDRYFLEIQKHAGVPNLERINTQLQRLSKEAGIPLVATNDSHYTAPGDHSTHDLYMAMQTQERTEDEDRLMFRDHSYYLTSAAEMARLFPDCPEALATTQEIGQACRVELDFGRKRLPQFPRPAGMEADDYLRQLCEQGFERRCRGSGPEYRRRLEYELDVVRETAFADYFLIVWDIIKFAREKGIQLGVRGSAAASLVLYCLDITVADPIEHSLVFERFLNRERKEMPDIDMDFQDDRRDEVMRYVVEKYGHRNVAQIMSFSRYGVKSALRAAARAIGIDNNTADAVAKATPSRAVSIEAAVSDNPELTRMGERDEKVARLLRDARGLEGVVSHTSSHPAGVVISSEPLDQIAPLQQGTSIQTSEQDETPIAITQYSMDPIAKLGLLKMDFLGLANLTILDQAMKLVPDGPQRLEDIPLEDPDTYRLLGSGNTDTVFQLGSAGMQRHIKDLRPTSIGDISAMIALYRPGPMDNIDRFIRSKHGMETTSFPHPSMEELLQETYGVIVYQDQVLQILQNFAGYSMGAADVVRKAMGKKIPKLMRDERERFVKQAGQMGHAPTTASEIFDIIEPFAGYAFNKAHSVSYALISYWTAWYKANHPVAYMTATVNCRLNDSRDKYREAVSQARDMRIPVVGPSVNQSDVRATTDGASIRLGTSCITGIPETVASAIVAERRASGPYSTVHDFCTRSPRMTAKGLQMIIQSGALDELDDRAVLLHNCQGMSELINDEADARNKGQLSMFTMDPADADQWLKLDRKVEPADSRAVAQMEREALGISITWDPSELLKGEANRSDVMRVADLESRMEDHERSATATVIGFVMNRTERKSRDGKQFVLLELAMADGSVEIGLWNEKLIKASASWNPQAPVRATGPITQRDGRLRLNADRAHSVDEAGSGELRLTLRTCGHHQTDAERMRRALRVLMEHPGQDSLYVLVQSADGEEVTTLDMGGLTCEANGEALRARLSALKGVVAVE